MQNSITTILLLGLPKVGKTTLLWDVIHEINPKTGFITREIRDQNSRTGFSLNTSFGRDFILASTTKSSLYSVGKYFVQLSELDEAIKPLFQFPPSDLLYIDEIGQMELFSELFRELVINYIEAPNLFVGTLSAVFEDPFIQAIRTRKDVQILRITEENRESVKKHLQELISTLHR